MMVRIIKLRWSQRDMIPALTDLMSAAGYRRTCVEGRKSKGVWVYFVA